MPPREITCLDAAQAQAVRAAVAARSVGPLVAVALGSACRQGELLGLHWPDVDLAAGTLTVRRSLSKTKGGYVLKEPKTAASRRTIRLPAFAVKALADLRAGRERAGLLDAPVFCTRTGGFLHGVGVLRSFRRATAKLDAACRTARFHDLRHTAASLLLSSGMSCVRCPPGSATATRR